MPITTERKLLKEDGDELGRRELRDKRRERSKSRKRKDKLVSDDKASLKKRSYEKPKTEKQYLDRSSSSVERYDQRSLYLKHMKERDSRGRETNKQHTDQKIHDGKTVRQRSQRGSQNRFSIPEHDYVDQFNLDSINDESNQLRQKNPPVAAPKQFISPLLPG